MTNRHMAILLLGIGLFNITDYFFTVKALSLGAREANPIMNMIVHTPLFPLVKLILVPGALVLIWIFRSKIKRLRKQIMLLLLVAFMGYLAVNVYHLYWKYIIGNL